MLNLSISICFIILLFIVPGALARKAYNSVKLSDYHRKASSLSEIVLTIALSMLIQFIALLLIGIYDLLFYCPHQVNYHDILSLLSFSSNTDPNILKSLENDLMWIFLYQLIIYALCVIVSRWFLGVVIDRRLDQKYPFLRFDNEWHYILTGRLINPNHAVIKYANVLVDIDDDSYIIYSGILTDYNLNKDGDLNIIEMISVKRKIITKAEPNTSTENIFSVNSFFIPYVNIKNFSITYFDIEPVEKAKAEVWYKKPHFYLIAIEVLFLFYVLIVLFKHYF